MSQKTIVTVTCDPHDDDDTEGTETISYAFDGTTYEIDVCAKHAKDLREGFTKYIEHSRRVAGTRPPQRRSTAGRQRSGDIRAWAKEHGLAVSERGRIPVSVQEQYNAAAH